MASDAAGKGSSYKSRKEQFVSDLSGGSLLEINLVTLVAPVCGLAILLWSSLQSKKSLFTPYGPASLVVDFLLNVCAILFAVTAYSSAPHLLVLLLSLPAVVTQLIPAINGPSKKAAKRSDSLQQNGPIPRKTTGMANDVPKRPFLTNYRGAMMVVTCISILAVDFRVFPRRFAKVENWGTSLMDLGVGSFVFSAGVVSARSLIRKTSDAQKSFLGRLSSSLRHSLPLLLLGFIRLYSVKGLDYAEHVTEYGVHWNFFFTLALVPPFVELSDLITATTTAYIPLPISYIALSLSIATTYEVILNTTSLKSYILVSPRGPSILSKNREGIFSFIGYLSIFLAGRSNGLTVLTPPKAIAKSKGPFALEEHARLSRRRLLLNMLYQTLVHLGPYLLLTSPQTPFSSSSSLTVSRRLANLPYVLWVAAFNNAQLALFCAIETFVLPDALQLGSDARGAPPAERYSSKIMQAFNKNGLVVFLVANLLTGLVNLTVNTLDMSDLGAMAILSAYAATLTAFALGLDRAGLRLKL